jgi:hypothetical protein
MALSTNIRLQVLSDLTSALDLVTPIAPLNYLKTYQLDSGTGANQADKIWTDTRTLTASSTENLDLAGVLTDAFGATVTFARVKALIISANSLNTNDVVVGGAATNTFINWVGDPTDKIKLKPGASFMLVAPDSTAYPVTAGTGDILLVANGAAGTSVTYDIVVIGASA